MRILQIDSCFEENWLDKKTMLNADRKLRRTSRLFQLEVTKIGDRSRGWPEGSLFDSYYTKV